MFIRLRHYAVPAAIAVLLATIATFMIWNTTKPVAVKSSKQHGWTSSGCYDSTWYALSGTKWDVRTPYYCKYGDGVTTTASVRGMDGTVKTCRRFYHFRDVRSSATKTVLGTQAYCDSSGWY